MRTQEDMLRNFNIGNYIYFYLAQQQYPLQITFPVCPFSNFLRSSVRYNRVQHNSNEQAKCSPRRKKIVQRNGINRGLWGVTVIVRLYVFFFHAQKTGCVLIPNHYVSTRRDTDFNLSLLNGVFNMNAPLLQKCDILMWSLMWNQLKRKYKREFSKQMAAIASRQQTCQINVKYAINQRKLALFITKIILLIRNFK